jgi:dihydroxyacetone kinase-like protein
MAESTVSTAQLADWLQRFRDQIADHRTELTDLDSAIGDADHGTNLARGMDSVTAKTVEVQPGSVADLLKLTGMTLISTVGGASGPLYGTFFLRMGMSEVAERPIGAQGLAELLRVGLDGVIGRGKAQPGDKTMIDAMAAAVDAFDAAVSAGRAAPGAAAEAAEAAAQGRDATEPMVARKGRASYLGERSVGHIDPGAASTALLFAALADALNDA